MDLYKSSPTSSGVPIDHLDYGYIEKCSNVKELEKIVKELRSGKEGSFPELERFAEKKLEKLEPSSKALRKEQPVPSSKDLGKKTWDEINSDLEKWSLDMQGFAEGSTAQHKSEKDLPPVRGTQGSIKTTVTQGSSKKTPDNKTSSAVPRDYSAWDRLDVDAELAKVDERPQKQTSTTTGTKINSPPVVPTIDTTNLTDQEKYQKAEHEKNKGNEAFKSSDYEEALLYYDRSISLVPTVASHNNRAQTYVKLKRWHSAVSDCNAVLKMEPSNIKAFLRRAVAYQGQRDLTKAAVDLRVVLAEEPANKRAKDLLAEVEKDLAKQKVKGRRMVIEEVEGSDESSEEEEEDSVPEDVHKRNQKNAEPSIEELPTISDEQASQIQANISETQAKTSEMQAQISEMKAKTNETQAKTNEIEDTTNEMQAMTSEMEAKISEMQAMMKETQAVTGAKSHTLVDKQNNIKSDTADNPTTSVKSTEAKPAAAEVVIEPPKLEAPIPVAPPALPDHVSKLKEKGNAIFRNGHYGDAIEVYTKAINALLPDLNTQCPNLAVLYNNRGACKYKIGDCSGCVSDCTKALDLTPGAAKPLVRRAMAYEAKEKFRKAYMDYRQVLSLDPTIDVAQQGSSRCGRMLQQLDGPGWREKLPKATPIYPASGPCAYPSLTPRPAVTSEDTRRQERLQQQQLEAEFNKEKDRGNACVKRGDFQKAVEHYSECVKCCPDKAVAYTNRALCNLRLNKPGLVIEDCNQALSLDFENAKGLFRRAQAYKMEGKCEESLIDLQTLLKIDPRNAAAKKEMSLVEKYKEEHEARRREEAAKRRAHEEQGKRRVHIQEVESSSDEEEEQVAATPTTTSTNASTSKETQSPPSNSNKPPASSPVQSTPQTKQKQVPQKSPSKATSPSPSKTITPTLSKASPYEFVHAWTSLKGVKDILPYVELIQQVTPTELPKVISNKLDGEMLMTIVQAMDTLITKGRKDDAHSYLAQLTKVPRFNMITMFMSASDKQVVKVVFRKLKQGASSSAVYTNDTLQKTMKAYGL